MALLVASEIVTVCADVYVPAAGVKFGLAVTDVIVYAAVAAADVG